MFTIRFIGVKEIDNVLKELPLALNHKILGEANAAAAKPLIEAEKLSAPEGPTGNLVDSIGAVKVPLKRANSLGEVHVGPRRHGGFKGYAGHLVEFGTTKRAVKGAGQYNSGNRGVMHKEPFIIPSWERTKAQVIGLIDTFIGVKLYQTMRRKLGK